MSDREIELKLQVPSTALPSVRGALQRGRCTRTRLRALYFDTPSGTLATAGWVLRLRREGRQWIQALKGPGDGVMSRFEHEVSRGAQRAVPQPDLALHADAAGAGPLLRMIDSRALALSPVFETDVQRTTRLLRSAGAHIEVALDEGRITANDSHLPVCEIEFELKSGSAPSLAALAARWTVQHRLWLDVRTKSDRGWHLANRAPWDPVSTPPPLLSPTATPDTALSHGLQSALVQVAANGAVLAAGDGAAEHVHHARVGLRRVVSIGRAFGAWAPSFDAALLEPLRALFRRLSAARDLDALDADLLPRLRADGAPPLSAGSRAGDAPDPAALFRAPEVTQSLLALLAFTHRVEVPASTDSGSETVGLAGLAAPLLARWHRRLRRDGKAFDALPDLQRHLVRKRLKRLRYAAESLSSLWPEKAWTAYLRRLKAAQDALGRLQDATVAQALFESQRESDPRAWFALGWLAARRSKLVRRAGRALRALGSVPRFLR